MNVTNIENEGFALENNLKKCWSVEDAEEICPIKDVIAQFGDKWALFTLLTLGEAQKMRFNEIKNSINGISQRMLTVTLRSMEEHGLLTRTMFAEIPPRVEYELTNLGRSLLCKIQGLADWSREHMEEIVIAKEKFALRSK